MSGYDGITVLLVRYRGVIGNKAKRMGHCTVYVSYEMARDILERNFSILDEIQVTVV